MTNPTRSQQGNHKQLKKGIKTAEFLYLNDANLGQDVIPRVMMFLGTISCKSIFKQRIEKG